VPDAHLREGVAEEERAHVPGVESVPRVWRQARRDQAPRGDREAIQLDVPRRTRRVRYAPV
jgi:hypothetical protein